MKLDKILEYQKIDQDLFALENEVAKSKERSALYSAKAKIDAATDSINKLSAEAGELLNGYNAMKSKIDDLKKKLDEYDGILDEMAAADEADYYVKQVGAIADSIAALEKETYHDACRIDEVSENYKKTWEAGIRASENFKSVRAEYDNFLKEHQPKVQQITAKLNELKLSIPKELMDAYNAQRAAKKLPAFVEFDVKNSTCKGCYMEVANDTKSRLRNPGDCVECPNCHRIMYIPEN